MNKVVIMGYLTRDMEIRYSGDLAVARGSIALDRGKDSNGEDRGADFPSLVAFGKRAEFLEKFGKKGRRFLIEGHLQTGSFEKDGQKHYTTDVVIDRIEFADSKTSTEQTAPAPATDADGFMYVPDGIGEELPFN